MFRSIPLRDQVDIVEVGIDLVKSIERAISRNRCEGRIFEIVVELHRETAIFVGRARQLVQRHDPIVELVAGKYRSAERQQDCVSTKYRAARAIITAKRSDTVLPGQRCAADFIDFGIIGNHTQGKSVVRRVTELQPAADTVDVVDDIGAGSDLVDVTVPIGGENSGAQCQHIGLQRDIRRSTDVDQTEFTAGHFDESIRLVAGTPIGADRRDRSHQNRAGRRVLAEQRALRATQYLDRLQVDQVVDDRALARTEYFIHVQADG